MESIELKLPGKNPTVIPISGIRSLALQLKSDATAYDDMVFIGINGWDKPFMFEGPQAKDVYEKLKGFMGAIPLEF